MQRYGIPFDYIEEHWTWSQWCCLLAAMRTEGKRRGMNAGEYAVQFGAGEK
jgi:hypothetical protein